MCVMSILTAGVYVSLFKLEATELIINSAKTNTELQELHALRWTLPSILTLVELSLFGHRNIETKYQLISLMGFTVAYVGVVFTGIEMDLIAYAVITESLKVYGPVRVMWVFLGTVLVLHVLVQQIVAIFNPNILKDIREQVMQRVSAGGRAGQDKEDQDDLDVDQVTGKKKTGKKKARKAKKGGGNTKSAGGSKEAVATSLPGELKMSDDLPYFNAEKIRKYKLEHRVHDE
jgi:hypothetical protein